MARKDRSGDRNDRIQYRCSFCGKAQEQVRRLIAGPGGVYICNECVDLCQEIIAEEVADTPIEVHAETGTAFSCTLCGRPIEGTERWAVARDLAGDHKWEVVEYLHQQCMRNVLALIAVSRRLLRDGPPE